MKLSFIVKQINEQIDIELKKEFISYKKEYKRRDNYRKSDISRKCSYIVSSYYEDYDILVMDKRKLNKFIRKYGLKLTSAKILHGEWNNKISIKNYNETLGTSFYIFIRYNRIL